MNEVKTPKKNWFYYYTIVLLILIILNTFIVPLLAAQRERGRLRHFHQHD